MHSNTPDRLVDATGLWCPEPLMLARHQLRQMAVGEILQIKATDPSTHKDFQDFCRFLGHELLQAESVAGIHHFRIRKGGDHAARETPSTGGCEPQSA